MGQLLEPGNPKKMCKGIGCLTLKQLRASSFEATVQHISCKNGHLPGAFLGLPTSLLSLSLSTRPRERCRWGRRPSDQGWRWVKNVKNVNYLITYLWYGLVSPTYLWYGLVLPTYLWYGAWFLELLLGRAFLNLLYIPTHSIAILIHGCWPAWCSWAWAGHWSLSKDVWIFAVSRTLTSMILSQGYNKEATKQPTEPPTNQKADEGGGTDTSDLSDSRCCSVRICGKWRSWQKERSWNSDSWPSSPRWRWAIGGETSKRKTWKDWRICQKTTRYRTFWFSGTLHSVLEIMICVSKT